MVVETYEQEGEYMKSEERANITKTGNYFIGSDIYEE